MKKHIANIITFSRIIASITLLFCSLESPTFYIIYLFCGLSDMIDGTVARKLNTHCSIGSKLDSIADFVFMTACLIKILPAINLSVFLWVWISIIALVKILNIILVFVHKKKLIDMHTILNKATGFALFILPLTLKLIKQIYSFILVCMLATIAAIQETYLTIKYNKIRTINKC